MLAARPIVKHQTYKRGDIFWADLRTGYHQEDYDVRPVVIVQNDTSNKFLNTVIIAPITSSENVFKKNHPTQLHIDGYKYSKKEHWTIRLEAIRTIDKILLKNRIAHLDQEDTMRLDAILARNLEIKNQEGKRMNEIQKVFNYQGSQVRTVIKDGESWFCAKDVCDILKHSNSRVAVDRLDEDEKGVSKVYTPGGIQDMTVVNEAGLYSLVLTSNLPEAKAFKRWITHEVIPQIRKTGSYSVKPMSELEILKKSVDMLIEQKQKLSQVEDKLETVNHRINSLDAVNVEGDPQQRLVKMVQKLAYKAGITYSNAWNQFKDAFNTAYRTNLTARINNYCQVNNLKKITIPAFLAEFNQLEDGIRVADKLLNM